MIQQILIVSSLNSIAPANYLIDAFRNLGLEVIAVSDVANERAHHLANGGFDVENYIKNNNLQPDLLLFIEGGEMGILPINYQKLHFPKYWWGIDTPHDYSKHLRISRLFDHTFLAQKSFVDDLQRDGIKSVSWLPLAFGDQVPTSGDRNIDLAYIGSVDWDLYPERREYLSVIENNFNNIYVGTCSPGEMFSIYRKSKIVFNFSFKNDVNMRVFEAIGSGALLVTNKIINNGMEDILLHGTEFVEYSNQQDMLEKINYYLSHQDELQTISSAGMRRVTENHSYFNRAQVILELAKKDVKSRVNQADFATALLSLGFLSSSLQQFLMSLNNSARGRKNRLIVIILQIYFRPSILFIRMIEKFAIRMRKRKW